jgi:hypothetical protein
MTIPCHGRDGEFPRKARVCADPAFFFAHLEKLFSRSAKKMSI